MVFWALGVACPAKLNNKEWTCNFGTLSGLMNLLSRVIHRRIREPFRTPFGSHYRVFHESLRGPHEFNS
jgi:hypothetical protein